jgi:ATP-dependent Clp protease adaptor protein ClpS
MSSQHPPKRSDPEHDGEIVVAERRKTSRAKPWNVVFHNDDYTTMDFVVHVLMKFFHKGETEATQIMLEVHYKGHGIVGAFSRDEAETKAELVMDYAKKNGHPLRVTAEPGDDREDDE